MFINYTPLVRYFLTISLDVENKECSPQKTKDLKKALFPGCLSSYFV